MEKEFIPYEQALALKELGFDEPCFWWYDFEKELRKDRIGVNSINSKYFLNGNSCSAPLYQQAFRWFREKHLIDVAILKMPIIDKGWVYYFQIEHAPLFKDTEHYFDIFFEIYEEAELACLKKLIEIAKTK